MTTPITPSTPTAITQEPSPWEGGATVQTSCLVCGRELVPVALGPDHAPWTCPPPLGCAHSWWSAELTAEARSAWVASRRTFHSAAVPALRNAVRAEQEVARGRGTSLPHAALQRVPGGQLKLLAQRLPTGPISTAIADELARRANPTKGGPSDTAPTA